MLKSIIKYVAKPENRKLRNFIADILSFFVFGNLNTLARIHRCDKLGGHFYTPHYMHHFKKFRFKSINLLEIGVGGYKDPEAGGHSLRMWKRYFPFGRIFGIDIYDKSPLQERRINIFQGSQVDHVFLEQVTKQIGEIDLIIDDGSHQNQHVIETFKILFPKLKDGGIYVVEDTQTSYWDDFGGDSNNLKNPTTMMNFFKALTDCMNHEEFILPHYEKTYFDRKIISMHFYHNLIFIYKGDNNEKSTVIENNQRKPKIKK